MGNKMIYKAEASSSYAWTAVYFFLWLLFFVFFVLNIDIVDTYDIVCLVVFVLFILWLLWYIISCIKIYRDEELVVYDDRIEHYEHRLFKHSVLRSYSFVKIDKIRQSPWYYRRQKITISMEGRKCEIFTGCYKDSKELFNTMEKAYKEYLMKSNNDHHGTKTTSLHWVDGC